MGLHKIIKIVALLLSVAGIIFFVMILREGDDVIENRLAAGEDVAVVNWALYTAYIIFAVVLTFVLIFVLKGILAGDIKKTLIVLGVFLAVIVIAYMLSSGSDVDSLPLVDGVPISESGSKWVGTGLHTFYILAILAIAAMVLSGVKKITK